MTFSLNTVTLVGRVSKYGVKRRDGTAHGALELVEEGRDEKLHTSYVAIHIWGREGAPAAVQMPPGSLVLVSGQIRPKKVNDQWTAVVAAREMLLLDDQNEGKYDTESAVGGNAA